MGPVCHDYVCHVWALTPHQHSLAEHGRPKPWHLSSVETAAPALTGLGERDILMPPVIRHCVGAGFQQQACSLAVSVRRQKAQHAGPFALEGMTAARALPLYCISVR